MYLLVQYPKIDLIHVITTNNDIEIADKNTGLTMTL